MEDLQDKRNSGYVVVLVCMSLSRHRHQSIGIIIEWTGQRSDIMINSVHPFVFHCSPCVPVVTLTDSPSQSVYTHHHTATKYNVQLYNVQSMYKYYIYSTIYYFNTLFSFDIDNDDQPPPPHTHTHTHTHDHSSTCPHWYPKRTWIK